MVSDRASLAARQLPAMKLSDGGPTSKTAPPPPLPASLTAAQRAQARFKVQGNAIITGGAGTLALSAARALLEHGLTGLILFDLSSTFDTSDQDIQALRRDFPDVPIATKVVDVTNASRVDEAVEQSAKEFETLDILLCYAGIVSCVPTLDVAPEQWRKTLDVNTTGSFLCAQAVAKRMAKQATGGSIMLTASISGHWVNYPQPQVAYNVSKAALIALKSSLAAEWAVHGVRVNSISPGYQDTVLNEGPGLQEARDIWTSRCPFGRMGAPGELDGAVVLLCSRAGSYITGADIVIDGGQTIF